MMSLASSQTQLLVADEPSRIGGCAAAPATDRRPLVEIDPEIAGLFGNRWLVIGLLLVAGPLGLPALWLSRRFGRTTKIITSVVFFLATVVAPLAITYYWLEIALQPLVEAFRQVKR